MNSEQRVCKNCKQTFIIEPEDFEFYEKMKVSPPTWCPECRLMRRLCFRNERSWHKRACDMCKRSVVSVHGADAPMPVYCQKCWWGDSWDPMEYGRDFDFSRPFGEQFKELMNTVPALSMQNDDGVGSVNSEYSYDWAFSKNVYMCVCGWYAENTFYSMYANHDKDVCDSFFASYSELIYDMVNCDRCARSRSCTLCFNCNDCVLGYDLRGCQSCVMCVGLRNKRYCIKNEQYSKEDYEQRVAGMELYKRSSFSKLQKELEEFSLLFPRKFAYNLKTLASTGDMLLEVKMSKDCFYIIGPTENCRFVYFDDKAKDCYDLNNTGNPELCYEGVTPDNSRGNISTVFCWKCVEAEYSINCHSSTSCFGSIALKHKTYSILNKAYTKEEFLQLREKIILHMKKTGEWGEFFSPAISYFAYNESIAQEWFPFTKEHVLKKGWRWKEEEKKTYQATIQSKDLPDTIAEVTDDFLNKVIGCEHKGECSHKCATAFKITPLELVFYRKMNVPLPTLCGNCRHTLRITRRNPMKLWQRRCVCQNGESKEYTNTAEHFHGDKPCPNEFQTTYSPERGEMVYCEQCYQSEIN